MATTLAGTKGAAARTAAGRQLHLANPLMKGDDVREAQRLLLHNKFGKFDCGEIDGEYGPATANATLDAKRMLGYPDANCNQAFGEKLRAFLSGEEKLPADFAHRREVRLHNDGDRLVRNKIMEYALWGCRNESSIHYSNLRPVEGLDHVKMLPLHTDCSGFVTLCYKWAGGPDPNGSHFDGEKFPPEDQRRSAQPEECYPPRRPGRVRRTCGEAARLSRPRARRQSDADLARSGEGAVQGLLHGRGERPPRSARLLAVVSSLDAFAAAPGVRPGAARYGRSALSGSTAAPLHRSSKWRCGPFASPVAPTSPTRLPASTRSPTRTSTRERCAYIVRTSRLWAIVTRSPKPPGR